MYRKIICVLVFVCLVFTGCKALMQKSSYLEVSRRLLKLKTYTCEVTMKVANNKSVMEYKVKHYYKSPDKYRVEVLEPKELEGQVTIYNGSSSYIYHPRINQYLVTENFSGSVEYNSFIGSFMDYLKNNDNIRVSKERDGEKELTVLEFELPEPNSYMRLEKIWIDTENNVPVKAEIYSDDGKTSVEVYYTNFVYNLSLKDEDFEIIQKN